MLLLSPRSYGTLVLVILHLLLSTLCINFQLFNVIKTPVVFAMLASSANTLGCLLLVHFLVHQHLLNSFIVMFGPLQF